MGEFGGGIDYDLAQADVRQVFPFDDGESQDFRKFEFARRPELTFSAAFDNGHLKTNPDEARKMVEGLASIMKDDQFRPENPFLIAFRSIWLRLSYVSVKSFMWLYMLTDTAGFC